MTCTESEKLSFFSCHHYFLTYNVFLDIYCVSWHIMYVNFKYLFAKIGSAGVFRFVLLCMCVCLSFSLSICLSVSRSPSLFNASFAANDSQFLIVSILCPELLCENVALLVSNSIHVLFLLQSHRFADDSWRGEFTYFLISLKLHYCLYNNLDTMTEKFQERIFSHIFSDC